MIRSSKAATTAAASGVADVKLADGKLAANSSPGKPSSAVPPSRDNGRRAAYLTMALTVFLVVLMTKGAEVMVSDNNDPGFSIPILLKSVADGGTETKMSAQSSSPPLIIKTKWSDAFPSARNLLTSPPPFKDSDIVRFVDETLVTSHSTIVTGYFRVPSKHSTGKYDQWMQNMLSLQDAMVIFVQPDLVDQIRTLRSHATNRTVIVPLALDDVPIGTLYPVRFWEDQLERDPERLRHRSYQVFWIWLSKSWCVTQAIRMNVFQSDLFVWSDIGCFRGKGYNSETVVVHPGMVPPHEILQMAHRRPDPPTEELFNDKYQHKPNFYHSGSQLAGHKDTWLTFHGLFLETVDRFLERNMIVVEDQLVLQSTCMSHPNICAYVPPDQVRDNNYFGLRYVLHHGGNYTYWRHPRSSLSTRGGG